MKHLIKLLCICGSMLYATNIVAQSNSKKPKTALSKKKDRQAHWEAGFLGGVAYYSGDLNGPEMRISNVSPSGGLYTRYNFNDIVYTRANLQLGNIKGQDSKFDDIYRKARNFSFTSTFYDVGLLVEIEPLGKKRSIRTSSSRFFLSPYFHFGISGVLSKPLVDFNEPNSVSSQAIIDKDKNNSSFFHAAIPIGVGLRYDINSNWMLGAELGIRRVFTDYLDGISRAGNPDKNDWFETANLVLGYRFAAFRDRDGDGIPNEQDACPLEAGSRKSRGCPDKDSDGIPDKTDYCPDAPGTAQTFGCPDADADGIVDKDDSCPNEYGTEAMKGCPDKDGDGLIDKDDQCPDLKGDVANFGCPDADSDSDGIPDYKDKCPEKAGVLSFEGCPDTSAIARLEKMRKDSVDKIAADIAALEASKNTNTKEVITKEQEINKKSDRQQPISFSVAIADISQLTMRNNEKDRTTILKPEDLKILQEAEEGLFFDQNKSVIKAKSFVYLNRIVDLMNRNPTYVLRIVGHTDNTGKELANVVLSVSRAHSVYDYLIAKGISFKKLSFMGAGSTKPAADNSTPEGRAKNRRADVQIIEN